MKKIFQIIVVAVFALSCHKTFAQQDLLLSQEIFSRVNKNPAATGNTDDIDIFLHGRIQWAGVDNGPKTTVLNVTDYEDDIHSGFGFSLSMDRIGVGHKTVNGKLAYSFQITMKESMVLALGLGAGVNVGGYDYLSNSIEDESERFEEDVLSLKEKKASPDFDLGLELSNIYWTFGFSCTHLMNKESTPYKSGRHLYLYWTSLFPVNDKFDLAPTVSYMHHDKFNVMEIGSLAFINRTVWGGVSWRPDFHSQMDPSVLVLTAGFECHKCRFGYSFDLGLGSASQLPSSTHEVILSYGIGKNKKQTSEN